MLGDTLTVTSVGRYSDLAIGIKADGRLITSGPADELVSAVVFVTQMKSFLAQNAGDFAQIKEHCLEFDLHATYTASFQGVEISKTVRAADLTNLIVTTPPTPIGPRIQIARSTGSGPMLSLVPAPGMENQSYQVQFASGPSGPWVSIEGLTLTKGQTYTIPTQSSGFYKLVSPE